MAKTTVTTPLTRPLKGTSERDRELQKTAAQAGAPTFTLVGWDRSAPGLIREWAVQAARAGSNAEKVGSAVLYSVTFEKWQVANGSKIPD